MPTPPRQPSCSTVAPGCCHRTAAAAPTWPQSTARWRQQCLLPLLLPLLVVAKATPRPTTPLANASARITSARNNHWPDRAPRVAEHSLWPDDPRAEWIHWPSQSARAQIQLAWPSSCGWGVHSAKSLLLQSKPTVTGLRGWFLPK